MLKTFVAQDIFQSKLDAIFIGMEGVTGIADDMIIAGKDEMEHDRNFLAFMEFMGMPVWVQHRQNTSWEPATVVSQCTSNSYWIMQGNGTDQPKVYRRTRTMLKIRCTDIRETRHSNSQSTESEKAEFHTPAIPNVTRNCVKHNSAENISQDLVHPNKSDTEASASFDFKSEEREEIAEIVDVPAFTPAPTPAPALERVEEQSHTPGSCTCTCTGESRGTFPHSRIQKVNEKELWKASQFI